MARPDGRAGGTGIRILAPVAVKQRDDDGEVSSAGRVAGLAQVKWQSCSPAERRAVSGSGYGISARGDGWTGWCVVRVACTVWASAWTPARIVGSGVWA